MMIRAAIGVACVLMVGCIAQGAAPEAFAAPSAAASDCAPPDNFAKRFPTLDERKAKRKVTQRITYVSPNVMKADNPVTGAFVTSNNLYAKIFLGVPQYGRDHTFAAITQPLAGERKYALRISDTEYTKGSQAYFINQLAELHVPVDGQIVVVPRTDRWEEGYCASADVNGPPADCFNTAIGSFDVSREIFEALAASDPSKPIPINARMRDGTMKACPYYFAPLSFKATLLTIDEAFAKAAAKDARNRGR